MVVKRRSSYGLCGKDQNRSQQDWIPALCLPERGPYDLVKLLNFGELPFLHLLCKAGCPLEILGTRNVLNFTFFQILE